MKKNTFEIVPHVGILPVKLGMSQEEVEQVMLKKGCVNSGKTTSKKFGLKAYYLENSFQVSFDLNGYVDFIEISSHADITAILFGKDAFRHDAKSVFTHIQENGGGDELSYNNYEHLFRSLILTLYDADEQYDRHGDRFPVWAAIGVGNDRYLAAVDAIEDNNSE